MNKIISNAICLFIGAIIGIILIVPITGLYELLHPLCFILLIPASLIAGFIKYYFIDEN